MAASQKNCTFVSSPAQEDQVPDDTVSRRELTWALMELGIEEEDRAVALLRQHCPDILARVRKEHDKWLADQARKEAERKAQGPQEDPREREARLEQERKEREARAAARWEAEGAQAAADFVNHDLPQIIAAGFPKPDGRLALWVGPYGSVGGVGRTAAEALSSAALRQLEHEEYVWRDGEYELPGERGDRAGVYPDLRATMRAWLEGGAPVWLELPGAQHAETVAAVVSAASEGWIKKDAVLELLAREEG